ncbi:E3 SUMO-protein ligase NSE2-like isoform X2 [Lineus longissimus]
MSSSGGKFGMVDQALNTLKKVEQYIMAGIETTIDVSLDLVECDKENSESKVNDLKEIMLQYAAMERDLKQFTENVGIVKAKAKTIDSEKEWPDLNQQLDDLLNDAQSSNNVAQLEGHEKYLELKQKIWDILHPDEPMPTQETAGDEGDDEVAVTQQDINTRCPYLAREMTNPWRNLICKHNYDKEAVDQMLKQRKSRCPVQGCYNDKPLQKSDLDENKELKKYIEMKNRQGKQRRREGGTQLQKATAHK